MSTAIETMPPCSLVGRWKDRLDGERDLSSVVRGAAQVLGIRLVGAGLAYGSMVLLARRLGAFEFGIYAYIWVWVLMLGILLPLGYNSSTLRFVPEYYARGKWRRLSGFLRESFFMTAAASTCAALLGALIVYAFADRIQPHYYVPLLVGLACLPLGAMWAQLEHTARALNWVYLAYLPGYVVRPALLILSLAAITATALAHTAVVALWLTVATLAVTLIGQAIVLFRRYRRRVAAVTPFRHTRQWAAISLSLVMVEGFRQLLETCDILVIGQILPPDQVAIYFAAIRTGSLIAFVYFAVAAIAVPKFSKLYNTGGTAEMQSFISGMIHLMFWPSLGAALGVAVIGPFVLPLFGDGFANGYPVLLVVLLGLVIRSSLGPVEYMLNMTGHHRDTAWAYGLAAIGNLLLNFAVVPHFGILGAAIASYGVIVSANVWLAIVVRRRLGIVAFVWPLWRAN